MSKERINVTIDTELLVWLKEHCDDVGGKVSSMIEKQMTILSASLLEPAPKPSFWDVKRQFRWVLKIDGLESFCINDVDLPKVDPDGLRKTFAFSAYDTVSSILSKSLIKLVDTDFDSVIQFLESDGDVASEYCFGECRIRYADFGTLDYQSSDNVMIKATIEFKTFEIK